MGKKPNLMYANKGEYLWHFCCYYITIIICLDCHSIIILRLAVCLCVVIEGYAMERPTARQINNKS